MESNNSEKTVMPNLVIQTPPRYEEKASAQSWKTSGNCKVLILAFTAITIALMVITGFVLGFKYHSETTKSALSNTKTITDSNGKETIDSSDDGMTKLYTMQTSTDTLYVLYDYNTNLRIMKRSSHCVVVPMNSSEADPETEYDHGTQAGSSFSLFYKRDHVPIRDTSFLGSRGEELCDGKLVYWGMPSCPDDDKITYNSSSTSVDSPSRQKRSGVYTGYYVYGGACEDCCLTAIPCGVTVCDDCVELFLPIYYSSSAGYHYHCYFVYGPGPC